MENVRIYAYHGVGAQENVVGNNFLVNLKIKVNVSMAVISDSLVDTISYADIFEIIKNEMAIPSKLLEHVGGRIISELKRRFTNIEEIELKLTKCNPPMGADLDGASVLLIE